MTPPLVEHPDPCAAPLATTPGSLLSGGVPLLVEDLHIRVINASTGELLRELTLDPARNYQPTGRGSSRSLICDLR
jgi:hypothetical protein